IVAAGVRCDEAKSLRLIEKFYNPGLAHAWSPISREGFPRPDGPFAEDIRLAAELNEARFPSSLRIPTVRQISVGAGPRVSGKAVDGARLKGWTCAVGRGVSHRRFEGECERRSIHRSARTECPGKS